MIEKATIEFLEGLKANNHKDWFTENKKAYQQARENFLSVCGQLIEGLAAFDEAIAASNLEAKKCIMRINRDIRFSKDKSPYKTNFFCFINREGKKSPYAGYYLSVSTEGSFHGGGIYMPEPKVLAQIRQEIDYNLGEWEGIVAAKELVARYGEVKASGKLTRPPRGYEADNPAIEWIKHKGFYTQHMLDAGRMAQANMVADTLAGYQSLKPMVDFINRSMG